MGIIGEFSKIKQFSYALTADTPGGDNARRLADFEVACQNEVVKKILDGSLLAVYLPSLQNTASPLRELVESIFLEPANFPDIDFLPDEMPANVQACRNLFPDIPPPQPKTSPIPRIDPTDL